MLVDRLHLIALGSLYTCAPIAPRKHYAPDHIRVGAEVKQTLFLGHGCGVPTNPMHSKVHLCIQPNESQVFRQPVSSQDH